MGSNRGSVAPVNFMSNTLNEKRAKIEQIFFDEVNKIFKQ
jgi:hypothetical protein